MSDRIIPLADAPAPHAANPETEQPADPTAASEAAATFSADPLNTLKFKPLLVDAVSKVFDPEIPVNIYELGLVYDLDVDSAANVQVRMTLTAPGCPAAQTIPRRRRASRTRSAWCERREGRGRVGSALDARHDVGRR